jgi:hypothetical protein
MLEVPEKMPWVPKGRLVGMQFGVGPYLQPSLRDFAAFFRNLYKPVRHCASEKALSVVYFLR